MSTSVSVQVLATASFWVNSLVDVCGTPWYHYRVEFKKQCIYIYILGPHREHAHEQPQVSFPCKYPRSNDLAKIPLNMEQKLIVNCMLGLPLGDSSPKICIQTGKHRIMWIAVNPVCTIRKLHPNMHLLYKNMVCIMHAANKKSCKISLCYMGCLHALS